MCASLMPKPKRLGAELAFIPADSIAVLRKAFPDSEIKDALFVLERLARAQDVRKSWRSCASPPTW